MKHFGIIVLLALCALPMWAQQDAFEEFRRQQQAAFNSFRNDKQAEYDNFRRECNEAYADFMRKGWDVFEGKPAVEPVKEEPLPPVVYEAPKPQPAPEPEPVVEPEPAPEPVVEPEPTPAPAPEPTPEPKPMVKPEPKPQPKPEPTPEPAPVVLPVKEEIVVVPAPVPAPEPIAPVQPKPELPYKSVTVAYYGTLMSVGFPSPDNFRLKSLAENDLADAWKTLSGAAYDITIKNALDLREQHSLCDWAYMQMLQVVAEKHYGKTNEAVLMQAFLMSQSGYKIRLGKADNKLYMLVASNYDIVSMSYFMIEGTRFYPINCPTKSLQICQAKFDKEKSLSLIIAKEPGFDVDNTSLRTFTSKKGLTAKVSVNKNNIDFYNDYPSACINGDSRTRWAAYANVPLETDVKKALYPQLRQAIDGLTEKDAVGLLLNWVQTAFEYEYDDKVWGGDRVFFATETLYYPYCDCEDRAILFSRLVRDLVGLDVVLLYYPGHLATAVNFKNDVNGDYLMVKNRKFIVCDPTFIGAPVGRTMPGMDNKEAQVFVLKR